MLNSVGGSLVDHLCADGVLDHLRSHIIGEYPHTKTIVTVGRILDSERGRFAQEVARSVKIRLREESLRKDLDKAGLREEGLQTELKAVHKQLDDRRSESA